MTENTFGVLMRSETGRIPSSNAWGVTPAARMIAPRAMQAAMAVPSLRIRASTSSHTGVNASKRDCRPSAVAAVSESQTSTLSARTAPCSTSPNVRS